MTAEQLHSREFIGLEAGFLKWLKTLNYSPSTIGTRRRNVREFLLYLERCGIATVETISDYKANRFVRYLKRRENKLYGSGLTNASINVGISSANKFFEYLRQMGMPTPENLEYVEERYKPRNILTLKEINQLYETTWQKHHFANDEAKAKQEAVGQRDRAMLSVYYGCGLRKSEGAGLNINDVFTERKLVHVRKGKGSKERYVPVTENNLGHITEYLLNGRNLLLANSENNPQGDGHSTEAFFINQYGTACSAQSLTARLKRLTKNSGSSILQKKKPSLHTLRHSIATHLLQQGMEIEMIQKFLGHSSLESTQVYTHIANEL